jgi:hypothetical protein
MQAAPTAAIVVRLDVLSSQMLIWYSLYICFLWLNSMGYFASFRSLQHRPWKIFDVLLLNLACVLSIMVTLPNCCCRQAVVVACLVLLVSQKCVCFCLYCLLNMLVLNSICLAAWQLHICLRIYCLLCYRWRQLEMAGLLVFLTAVLDLNIFPYVNLCFMGFTFLLLRGLFSLLVSTCGCILSAATSGLSFFCLVAAVDFLIQLHDSITFLLMNSWTFWSCEHFIRSL